MTGGERQIGITKQQLDSNSFDFKKVKEQLFREELSQNKNVRFVYQGKLVKDTDQVKHIRKLLYLIP